jgi:GNAT superfamily N-acetyltransferase
MSISIRSAEVGDAPALAEIKVASWKRSYLDLVPEVYLAQMYESEYIQRYQTMLEDRDHTIIVAEHDGRAVGFVQYGASRDMDCPLAAELYALYLNPAYIRQGIGSQLMEVAMDELASTHSEALLWLFADNMGALAFYNQQGWVADGHRSLHPRTGLTIIRLRRRLGWKPG